MEVFEDGFTDVGGEDPEGGEFFFGDGGIFAASFFLEPEQFSKAGTDFFTLWRVAVKFK